MSDFMKKVEDLIVKAKGSYNEVAAQDASDDTSTGDSGASMKVSKTEKNAANKGTHPKKAGGNFNEMGDDDVTGEEFQDGSEDTIGPEGHVSNKAAKSKDSDEDDEKKSDDEEEGDDAEKSLTSDIVYLDIDKFQEEMTAIITKSVLEEVEARLSKSLAPLFEEMINKSQDSDSIDEGLVKSVDALADRMADIEKAIENVAGYVATRKSVLSMSEKNIEKSHLDSTPELSKGQISEALLNKAVAGEIDKMVVMRFDASGDVNVIPQAVRKSIGL